MTLLHSKPPQLAFIAGKYVFSNGCTDVIGGTLTAGTADDENSALLTWQPCFESAPMVYGTINSGGLTTTSPSLRFVGVTACGGYVALGQSPLTNVTVGLFIVGQAKL